MPFQRGWQWETCEFNVQHPAASWAGGARGRMQQQRTHQQHVTSFGLTKNFLMSYTTALDRFCAQPAQSMRARKNSQSTVARIRVIQMQTHSEHLLQQLHWWLHMRHIFLHAPRSKSWHLGLFFESQRQILMPCDKPVGFRSFVKIDAAHWNGTERKMRADQFSQRRLCKLSHYLIA